MFSYCRPEEAEAEHPRLLGWEKEFLTALELPFRVIDVAAGDLGSSAARKFDCEAWFPSQQRYLELTSTSQLHDLPGPPARHPLPGRERQAAGRRDAQRHAVRGRPDHRLPARGAPAPDGSVHVPAALRPWLGGREVLEPVRP